MRNPSSLIYKVHNKKIVMFDCKKSVADPGFPIGGGMGGGVLTSDAYTFQRKHKQKRKKWILLGGGAPWIRQWE